MRHPKQHHFLAYTLEHILGAFFVISIAAFVGYAAYADTASSSTTTINIISTIQLTPPILGIPDVTIGKVSLLWTGVSTTGSSAQGFAVYRNDVVISHVSVQSYVDSSGLTPGMTYVYYIKTIDTAGNTSLPSNIISVTMPLQNTTVISTTTTLPATTPPPVTSTSSPVTFGVTIAPIVDCTSGKVMTEVFFVTSDGAGGSFKISSDNGITNAPLEWGRYPLPNGKYFWSAVVASGHTSSGDTSGYFQLSGVCPLTTQQPATTVSTTTPAGTSVSSTEVFPLKYPESSMIVPTVSIDNVRVLEGDTVSGVVTFDVIARGSTRTVFVLESSGGTKQYIDKQLGVIHKDGTNEWSTLWSTTNMNNGTYALAALMDTSAGTMISKKFTFAVKNSTSGSVAVTTAKKPVIKVYMNNVAIPSGAVLSQTDGVEFRVGAVGAKKVNFYATIPSATTPLELGVGVIDDLLSGKTQDIWTASWSGVKVKPGSYKVFARVLSLDGTVNESAVFLLSVTAPISKGDYFTGGIVASDTKLIELSTFATKEEILARVTNPAECSTLEECKIYCANQTGLVESCSSYVHTLVGGGNKNASLASGVAEDRILSVLNDPRKRSDIPTLVQNADDLLKFCADPSHADSCGKMLIKNDLATDASVSEKKLALIAAKDEEGKLLTLRTGARAFLDTDGDGLSDYDEVNIYHTDPTITDTDHDGVPDNIEIAEHTNPHGRQRTASSSATTSNVIDNTSEGVVFEDPLITGVEHKDLLTVTNVQVAEIGAGESGTTTAKKLFIAGHALPNSYVTLYVFSTPIVVTIKADASGAWTYTLDKELPNGSHQVISAITDEGGHILAKSEPLPFVKVAAAVSVGSNALLPANDTPGFFTGPSLYAFIAILIGLIGVAFSIIGFVVKGRTEKDTPLFPPSNK